jgi:hypothetical protein
MVIEGKQLESEELQLRELVTRAVRYRDKMLPLLQKLGAVA